MFYDQHILCNKESEANFPAFCGETFGYLLIVVRVAPQIHRLPLLVSPESRYPRVLDREMLGYVVPILCYQARTKKVWAIFTTAFELPFMYISVHEW